ncbi:hypothetical protein BX616_007145 [Lobosporangium transversale]|uniref:SWIRM domain-domain-containing protein n=1 Tax=Lobosporangium transversale TaxID=64571 RepID=A0A1Y2GXM4_9FUNG|nr:hypothetical protein BCR41DRAFT_419443 [Lobosporangium transversale]KAF9914989.1 hypothetical protein BX616_007145 [Lobosporangium transversale]ORZ27027.1 hypothetical protein BCR41DRAFT_419443 [Lobosporangium transversale]|eukprot:XP_021884774.1 hypothetical protein BCR41DRAFT_419443 [Lobosporangium transversale]
MAARKSGGSDITYYRAPDTIARFEHISHALARDLQTTQEETVSTPSGEELALFIYALQQFQEDVMGAHSSHDLPSPSARIPAWVFKSKDITNTSPIYKVLLAAYEYRHKQHWKEWDLNDPSKQNQYLTMVSHIRESLILNGTLKNPTIAFAESVSAEEQEKWIMSINRLGGAVTSDTHHASHIVHYVADESESSESEGWLRTVEKKDGKVLVHHWYYPDSYDEWVSETSGDYADAHPLPEHSGAWNVTTRWIRDSIKFNEWTNEEDYELNAQRGGPGAGSSVQSSQRYNSKRDNSDRIESLPKRIKRSSSAVPTELDNAHSAGEQRTGLSSEDATMEETSASGLGATQDLENTLPADADSMDVDVKDTEAESKAEELSTRGTDTKEASLADKDSNRGSAPPEAEEALTQAEAERFKLEEEAGRYLSRQTQEVIIPSYAAWFSLSKIHEIEHKSLPEFFNLKNRSKTPTVYKDYRDFMINTYRLNPSEYLTVTACRRNLAGDVCAIIRVHSFLEQWGLINYQVDPDTRPSSVGPAFTGHFRVTADTPRGLQPFLPSVAAPTAAQANGELKAASGGKQESNLELRRNIYANGATPSSKESEDIAEKKQRFNCFTCGTDCTKIRYHSIKTKNFELCSNCYIEGRFPSTMSSGDFIRLNAQHFKHATDDTWTDQETLLLLEGLEMYDEDWNQVAEHVGTRSREQCILHFLQMPIEDPYLGGMTERELGPLQYHRIPFSQADNPVMSVVAFLASVVNPNVAAAAAKSALKELEQAKQAASLENTDSQKEIEDTTKVTSATGDADEAPKVEPVGSDLTKMDVDKAGDSIEMKEDEEGSKDSDIAGVPRSTLERAGAAALGSAAAKAKILADNEEREVKRLVTQVVEAQMKKMELKLQQFEELESLLEIERRELERQRQQLYLDRLAMKKSIMAMQEKMLLARQTNNPQVVASITVPPGGTNGSGTAFQNEATVRQQQEQGQGMGPLSRDPTAENVVVMPLP